MSKPQASQWSFQALKYLPAGIGRWENVPLVDKKCFLYDKKDIGDEFHYVVTCPIIFRVQVTQTVLLSKT